MGDAAIVTGAASGIGLALAGALIRRSWDVVLADVQADVASDHAESLSRSGPGTAVATALDVRDAEAVSALVESVRDERGGLAMMVNNAGVGVNGEPDELTLAHWNRAIDVNLRGVIHGCHAAYPVMKAQGGGRILNVASLSGLMPVLGHQGPYAASKFGVVGLSLALRAAGAEYGVRVSALCPGFIDTPNLDKLFPDDLPAPPSLARAKVGREEIRRRGMPLYPPERVAEDTLKALEKDRAVIVVPRLWLTQWWLWRYTPTLSMKLATRLTEAGRRQLDRPSDTGVPARHR